MVGIVMEMKGWRRWEGGTRTRWRLEEISLSSKRKCKLLLKQNLLNEGELENGGVGKSEETLLSATLANPKVLNGEMDAEVAAAAVRHTLPLTKVSSTYRCRLVLKKNRLDRKIYIPVFEVQEAHLQDDGAGTGCLLHDRKSHYSMRTPHGQIHSGHHGHDPEEYSGSTRWGQVDWSWLDSWFCTRRISGIRIQPQGDLRDLATR